MAALIPLQVFKDGDAHRVCLYRLVGVNSGDTFDVASDFKKVINGKVVAVSSGSADFNPAVALTGTVVTITSASLLNDAVYVLCYGAAA